MFYYNRQIVYMDLWKAGERAGNAGFLKLEETDRGLRWQMRIHGLGESDTGFLDRKSTRLNSSHRSLSRMPSSA